MQLVVLADAHSRARHLGDGALQGGLEGGDWLQGTLAGESAAARSWGSRIKQRSPRRGAGSLTQLEALAPVLSNLAAPLSEAGIRTREQFRIHIYNNKESVTKYYS